MINPISEVQAGYYENPEAQKPVFAGQFDHLKVGYLSSVLSNFLFTPYIFLW